MDGSNSLIGEWMKLSGAKNSLDGVENLKNISLEQIIASQPEYIIIGGADAQKGVGRDQGLTPRGLTFRR